MFLFAEGLTRQNGLLADGETSANSRGPKRETSFLDTRSPSAVPATLA